uniref:Uncharacterized protein n=1 Tax=Mola mola TaxID=94237 RepID=A0A3Q3VJQ9_MOLML
MFFFLHPAAAAQAQAEERRSLAGNSPGPATNAPAKPQGCKPVIDGATLRIDDRLRVAKERREEADKQQALRESQIMERERKAKLQVERQIEERQRKVEEQRRKEEQKRVAAEEKRKQKQEEEKEHYEAVMRRTLERSQRVEQRQKRWSWGGLTDSEGRAGESDASASSPVAIVISPASPEKPPRSRQQVDKRSTSSMNLKQPAESGISKRLSSSSATLVKSPEKRVKPRSSSCNRLPSNANAGQASKEDGKMVQVEQPGAKDPPLHPILSFHNKDNAQYTILAHRPATTVDGGVLSRLLTPTQASLARSKSAAALSAEGKDAPASGSPLHPPRGPVRSRSIDRQKSGMTTSVSADGALDPSLVRTPPAVPGTCSPHALSRTVFHLVLILLFNTKQFSSFRPSSRTRPPSPAAMKQRPPSPQSTSAKPPPIQKPALTPTGPPTLRKRDSKSKDLCSGQAVSLKELSFLFSILRPTYSKGSTGTNSAAEAAKILAENRRLMREQKEREEQLRIQREEEEKLRKEEENRLAEEARLKRLEEEKKLAEERKIKEEEEARLAEEERVRQAEEEAVKQAELQREREEAEAKAQEEAERVRQDRDRIMQQNQQEESLQFRASSSILMCSSASNKVVYTVCRTPHIICFSGFISWCVVRNLSPPQSLFYTSSTNPPPPSPIPKPNLDEGSEFLIEDSAKVALVSGLNGKPNQWSFEELIDLNVHSKTRPLIENRVAFEDKGATVNSLHSAAQPIEALSGGEKTVPLNLFCV